MADCAPDCSAPRAGTLMRVASFRREADNRLSVVVQGVARCIVERGPAPASERNRDDRPPGLRTSRVARREKGKTARPASPCLPLALASFDVRAS